MEIESRSHTGRGATGRQTPYKSRCLRRFRVIERWQNVFVVVGCISTDGPSFSM